MEYFSPVRPDKFKVESFQIFYAFSRMSWLLKMCSNSRCPLTYDVLLLNMYSYFWLSFYLRCLLTQNIFLLKMSLTWCFPIIWQFRRSTSFFSSFSITKLFHAKLFISLRRGLIYLENLWNTALKFDLAHLRLKFLNMCIF